MNVEKLDDKIVEFIKSHHVMTLASVGEDGLPYCCNLFYSYIESLNMFIFTSDMSTKHALDMEYNNNVAGAVVLETSMIGKIRGLQFRGVAQICDSQMLNKAKLSYLKAFPFAAAAPLELWCCKLVYAKYTDNRLGFGKKIIWTI